MARWALRRWTELADWLGHVLILPIDLRASWSGGARSSTAATGEMSRGDALVPAGGLAELGAQGVSGRSERLDENRASVGYLVGKTGQTQGRDVAAGALR